MHIIIIPVYDDWKSLNKLLYEINCEIKTGEFVHFLIVNDFSKTKPKLKVEKLDKIKEIKILDLNKNLGSQKAIVAALNYLKLKKYLFYITIMDADGEDDPRHIKYMLRLAMNNKKKIVVSCRKNRKENIAIKICYQFHLIITFIFTGKWISFGNFSTFHSSNIKKILADKSALLAYSAAVMKNTDIIRTYSKRLSRYFDKSKVNFFFLITHSLRIISAFYISVFFVSLFYFLLINMIFPGNFFLLLFLILNIIIIYLINKKNISSNINSIKKIHKIKL